MISLHDYTDAIRCKTVHLQNEEDLGRIEMMQGEMGSTNLLSSDSLFDEKIKYNDRQQNQEL